MKNRREATESAFNPLHCRQRYLARALDLLGLDPMLEALLDGAAG